MRRNRDTGKRDKSPLLSYKMGKAVFVDAQAMHKQYPSTFQAPSMEELRKIRPGHMVKVSSSGERFWVRVLDRKLFMIIGRVDNELINTDQHGLRLGNIIAFHQNCVYSTMQA